MPDHHRFAAQHGASPLELIVVILAGSILLGTVVPSTRATLDRLAVAGAARDIAASHTRARMTAVLESRTTLLTVTADSIIIRVVAGTDTVVRSANGGPSAQGVALSGPTRAMRFSPVGIMMGVTNGTWRLSRNAAARNVVVSRLGRVRIVSP